VNDNATAVMIGGLSRAGKTAFICGLLQLANKQQRSLAAFKPFDNGLLKRNAAELPGDGSLFCRFMTGRPMETLVAPYVAHESYPIEMSLRRDGVRINWGFVHERLTILADLYPLTLIELPDSLFCPLSDERLTCDWVKERQLAVIWIIHPVMAQFTQNLAEIQQLKALGVPFQLVMNNASRIQDQDLLFYLWEKIELFSGQQVAGLIPYVKHLPDAFTELGEKIEANLPDLISRLLPKPTG